MNDCARGTQDVYTWDADGHAVTLDGNTVVYDALGRSVVHYATVSPSFYGPIVYSPMGQKFAVLSVYSGTPYLNRAYVPLPGGGTAVYALVSGSPALSFYWHPDWLGTARLGTTPTRGLYLDRAYAPYGEDYANSGASYDMSFTGISQDLVSVTYDFPARNYSALSGRWYSPDPAGLAAVDPADPQSWNRYAYVGNRPLNTTDPLGLDGVGCYTYDPHCGLCDPLNSSTLCGAYCPIQYQCFDNPCSTSPLLCAPDGGPRGGGGGGGGGGSSGTPDQGQRIGGRYGNVNNETLGLPPGINLKALSLGDLFGLNPNGPCDFGVCAPVGNGFGAAVGDVSGLAVGLPIDFNNFCRQSCKATAQVCKAAATITGWWQKLAGLWPGDGIGPGVVQGVGTDAGSATDLRSAAENRCRASYFQCVFVKCSAPDESPSPIITGVW